MIVDGKLKMNKLPGLELLTDKVLTCIKSVTIYKHVDYWYASITYNDTSEPVHYNQSGECGIDRGLSTFATIVHEDNSVEHVIHPLPAKAGQKLKALKQRTLAHKSKHSNNRAKALGKLRKSEDRIANIRTNFSHQLSSRLTKTKSAIGIESLDVKGLIRINGRASRRKFSDVAMSEFLAQLTYKSNWYGSSISVADRYYPSTKLCSNCGAVKESMPLSERTYTCACGLSIDRDVNAGYNLLPTRLMEYGHDSPELKPVEGTSVLEEAGNATAQSTCLLIIHNYCAPLGVI